MWKECVTSLNTLAERNAISGYPPVTCFPHHTYGLSLLTIDVWEVTKPRSLPLLFRVLYFVQGEYKQVWAPHSQHHFPAPSSKLCQIWLRHWRGTLYLRAAVHRRGQRLPKDFGTNVTVEANLAPKHARKHEAHPPRVKKEFCLDSNDFGFIWAGVSTMVSYKTNDWYNLSCL